MKINPDTPAFPEVLVPNGKGGTLDSYTGLTKREWLAGLSLQGILSSGMQENCMPISPETAALISVKYTDALIVELNKEKP